MTDCTAETARIQAVHHHRLQPKARVAALNLRRGRGRGPCNNINNRCDLQRSAAAGDGVASAFPLPETRRAFLLGLGIADFPFSDLTLPSVLDLPRFADAAAILAAAAAAAAASAAAACRRLLRLRGPTLTSVRGPKSTSSLARACTHPTRQSVMMRHSSTASVQTHAASDYQRITCPVSGFVKGKRSSEHTRADGHT